MTSTTFHHTTVTHAKTARTRAERPARRGWHVAEVEIADIQIGDRHRKDFGDLDALAASITDLGLLQPIGVTPESVLVFGERRLRACRDVLGWKAIPARVVNLRSILEGEFAENSVRKEWTVSERVAIVESLRSFRHGGDRRSDQARTRDDEALTVDRAAKHVGLGGKDGYCRARAVVDRGVPELLGALDRGEVTVSVAAEIAALDPADQKPLMAAKREWTVKEVAAHRKRLLHRQRQEELRNGQAEIAGGRCWVVTGDQSVVRCGLLIADPPFGITQEAWEPEDVGAFTKDWCRRWATCGADFVAVFWYQGGLWAGRQWFDEALVGYDFQQMLVWHAPNHCGPKSRHVLKQTWYPIFLYRRKGSNRQVITDGKAWGTEQHQLDCHVAPVPQTGYGGDLLKQHPCQKPVSVLRWLVNALSEPGERVASLFCCVSPCGVAAVQLGRQYHGVEADEEYRKIAEARLLAYGRPDPVALSDPSGVRLNDIMQGDCTDLIPFLPGRSVSLVLTSPPYGEQRSGLYPGVPDHLYPEFTLRWMSALWDKLADDGSVLLVIRPDLKGGVVKDYVLRTRLALREAGWKECETLIWFKPDGGACMGSTSRPRRTYEDILWFSKTSDPFVDPKACGRDAEKVSFTGSPRPGQRSFSVPKERPTCTKQPGRTKLADVIRVPVRRTARGIDHPAMFPVELAEVLIQTFCPASGTVLDPFCGSGTTPIAARRHGRNFYGFDVVPDYCDLARRRLAQEGGARSSQAAG